MQSDMNIDSSQSHYQSLLNDFNEQFEIQEFADCSLIAEGRIVKVHRAVLSAHSSFLKKLISDHNNADLSFSVDGVRYDDLKLMVQFLYKGVISVTSHQVGSFLVAAELLCMKWVDKVTLMSQQEPNGDILNYNIVQELNLPSTAVLTTTSSCSSLPNASSSTEDLPLRNITNTLCTKTRKRKKCEKGQKHSKKLKGAKNDGKGNYYNAKRSNETLNQKNVHLETDLAQMDENAFCSMLGLKKNCGTSSSVKPISSSVSRKSVPPLLRIISGQSKCRENDRVAGSLSNLVRESSPVYIEAKNLSFLNIDANELCFRENNIEIECDVLDVAAHQLVIDKENSGAVVQVAEGNITEAELTDSSANGDDIEGNISEGNSGGVTRPVSEFRKPTAASSISSLRKKSVAKRENNANNSGDGGGGHSSCSLDGSVVAGSSSTIFWCDVCQRTYHTKTGLNQHKRYECCKEPAFACPRCDKRFKRKSSLVRHAITLHNEAVYPTRTKLLSKLTSPRTIAGERVGDDEPSCCGRLYVINLDDSEDGESLNDDDDDDKPSNDGTSIRSCETLFLDDGDRNDETKDNEKNCAAENRDRCTETQSVQSDCRANVNEDLTTARKYNLKSFSIKLSRDEFKMVSENQKKLNLLNYFKLIEREKMSGSRSSPRNLPKLFSTSIPSSSSSSSYSSSSYVSKKLPRFLNCKYGCQETGRKYIPKMRMRRTSIPR